ncbi:hypothetical protein OBBRIDRAFT_837128 [Obba rivulosa]|uniref:Hydrophobin n=1 Tax=Obba rivulosa TaxID=1052685 RepID=A0A8E2AN58_9APHY|nr:hypothetical protein OBBRIDRAFT_837128 [Obba rivulosa]
MRSAILTTVAIATLAVASLLPPPSSCSSGTVTCCQQTGTAGSSLISAILQVLDIVVADLDTVIGVDCSGISILGSGACSSNTMAVFLESDAFPSFFKEVLLRCIGHRMSQIVLKEWQQ